MTANIETQEKADQKQKAQIGYELALERAIDQYQDNVVELAQDCLENVGMVGAKTGRFGKSQLNSAMTIASSTETSFQYIKNWLRYQMSRSQASWPPELAKAVIKDCEGDLLKLANTIIDTIIAKPELADTLKILEFNKDDQIKKLHIHLIRLYLGFMTRYYTYATSAMYESPTPKKGAN
jgi:hypothetical protein